MATQPTLHPDLAKSANDFMANLAEIQTAIAAFLDSHQNPLSAPNAADRSQTVTPSPEQPDQQMDDESGELARTLEQKLAEIGTEFDKNAEEVQRLRIEKAEWRTMYFTIRRELAKAEIDRDVNQEMLEALRRDLGMQILDTNLVQDEFKCLSLGIANLVRRHIDVDLTATQALAIVDTSGIPEDLPVLTSNSMPAKHMRCAFAEAVIAQVLESRIFQDLTLILDGASINATALLDALGSEAEADQSAMALIRCQLARICQLAPNNAVAADAASVVMARLSSWILRGEDFERELTSIFAKCTDLWRELHRSCQRPKAIIDINEADWWLKNDARTFYGYIPQECLDQDPLRGLVSGITKPVVTLFPQITIDPDMLRGAGSEILFHGFALFSVQQSLRSAQAEKAGTLNAPAVQPLDGRYNEEWSGEDDDSDAYDEGYEDGYEAALSG